MDFDDGKFVQPRVSFSDAPHGEHHGMAIINNILQLSPSNLMSTVWCSRRSGCLRNGGQRLLRDIGTEVSGAPGCYRSAVVVNACRG